MSPKKLNSYTGKLNPEQIAEGINVAAHNALRLSEDAQILFNATRYPSATAFAILSIEESGKIPILRSLLLLKQIKKLSMLGETTVRI
jgi:AbiV family abortive infection protein